MKHRRLPAGVYGTEIHVLYGTRAELNNYFARHTDREDRVDDRSTGQHSVYEPDDPKACTRRYISIVTDTTVDRAERTGVLIHEIVHCALSVFDAKGVKYSGDNDEHLAYFIEWLFNESIPILK